MGKKNKKIQFKKFFECGICYSVCSVDAKLMKSNDFNPDTVELAIWIVDKMAIINAEICALCGACSKICNV
jgi:4Fe-4S ferredoxin